LGKYVPLKLIMILFYAHWEIKGGLYQNLPINATEIPQLAYACDRTNRNREAEQQSSRQRM